MLKPSIDKLTDVSRTKDGLFWVKRGDPYAKQRLYLLVGTHGNEIAGPLALQKLVQEEWRWPNVQMTAVFQDPQGWKEEGYGFVGVDGQESMWPPMFGYRKNEEWFWFYVDENSAWGNNAVQTPRHKLMKELMSGLNPTFLLSLHETVRTEVNTDLFWPGAGILLIETWPISSSELMSVNNWVGNPLDDFVGWAVRVLVEWLRDLVGIRRWRLATRGVKKNPHYQLTTKIAERYVALGGELTGKRWMRYMEAIQQVIIGPGRMLHGLVSLMSEWRTATDYAVSNFGCPGVTTETFPCAEVGMRGIDQRVEQQLTYCHAVLDTLEGLEHEDN
jgi:hypothetical protein